MQMLCQTNTSSSTTPVSIHRLVITLHATLAAALLTQVLLATAQPCRARQGQASELPPECKDCTCSRKSQNGAFQGQLQVRQDRLVTRRSLRLPEALSCDQFRRQGVTICRECQLPMMPPIPVMCRHVPLSRRVRQCQPKRYCARKLAKPNCNDELAHIASRDALPGRPRCELDFRPLAALGPSGWNHRLPYYRTAVGEMELCDPVLSVLAYLQ